MAFVIEISEVGPTEYPLLQTLRDAIFTPFGHTSISSIDQQFADRQDLLTVIAHLEGNPVGFAAGYRRSPNVFYLNYLGLLADYRGQGWGRQMLERQEAFAQARQYRRIEFNTFNHFPGMIRLGLNSGYLPVGVEQHDGTWQDLAIRFAKSFSEKHSVSKPVASSGTELRIRSDDAEQLAAAVAQGAMVVGLVRDPQDGQLHVIVRTSWA